LVARDNAGRYNLLVSRIRALGLTFQNVL